jgi:hydroxysqualene dehydroxylase
VSARTVTVVGGGLAGITAALDCAQTGAAVTLLESRGRLGGAAYSFTRDGLQVDNGQHVFLRCCTAYRELLDRIGAADLVTLQSRLEIPVLAPGGRRAVLRSSALPAPLHLARALGGYPYLSVGERLGVARAMQRLRKIDPDDPAADARSFGDWLRQQRQTSAAVETIWSLIVRPTLNLVPDAASLAQAAQVFQLGLLADRAAGDVGYAAVPLAAIHDQAARRALEQAGVSVRLRRGVTMITQTDAGFRIEINGAPTIESDLVILAVPPDRATRLLPATAGVDPHTSATLGHSPIVNLHMVFDRRVLDVPFAAGVDTPVQWVFDRTSSAGLTGGQYLAMSLSAADEELNVPPGELRATYLPALAELLPAARGAELQAFFVTREHAATFRAAPGARAWRPGPRTALPGLLLAGCWTDTGWPATMEGAVRSGRAAAAAALAEAVPAPRLRPAPVPTAPDHEPQLAGGRP